MFGRVYQAFLARALRRHGIDVALDMATGAARITAIPEHVRAAFSKRTRNGTEAARAYARDCGLDWDSLDDARKVGLTKEAFRVIRGKPNRTTLPIGLPGDVKLPSLGGNHRASFISTRLLHLWIARPGLSTLTRSRWTYSTNHCSVVPSLTVRTPGRRRRLDWWPQASTLQPISTRSCSCF